MKPAVGVLLLVASIHAAKLPPSFKKCNRKDPNLNQCILQASEDGLRQLTKPFPSIGLPSFDPLEVTELTIGAGSDAVVNLEQKFKDCKLYGIDKTTFSQFEADFPNKNFKLAGVIPEIKMLCQYELSGKVLLLPVVGQGPSTIILKSVKVALDAPFEEIPKDGKTYFKFSVTNFSLDPEVISFDFENLFNGDKTLGDNINKVLNDNSKEVFADVKDGYAKGIGLILEKILNSMFTKVSIEEAYD
ncbi:protein takeout-like [Tenebrio molitor]|uniref:protein takeout-like n=1 Tax=Tenebrio molitor TaxID=7067 RepID=UPI003624898A